MSHSPLFNKFRQWLGQAHRANLRDSSSVRKNTIAWTRRRFIRMATLAGGGALASQAASKLPRASSESAPKIAIIGGGIAGLNAAYQLQKQGIEATVYEARARLGGRIYTQYNAFQTEQYLNLGGSFINSEHKDMLSLVEEFGLTVFDIAGSLADAAFPIDGFYFGKQSLTEAAVAGSLRPLAQQIAEDAERLDEDFEAYAPELDQLSVTDYLNQHQDKISAPYVRDLINSMILSEYGAESEQSSALQLLFALPAVEDDTADLQSNYDEAYIIEGGSGQIIDHLNEKLSGQIQLRKSLTCIATQPTGFQLAFADNEIVTADYVILTLPPGALKDVKLIVDLPSEFKRFLDEIELGRNDKLFAQFNEKVWHREDGFVNQFWCDESFAVAWDASIATATDAVLAFFYGGNQSEALQTASTQSQGEKALEVLDGYIPESQSAATYQFTRTNWASDRYSQGAYANFKPGQLSEFAQFLYYEADDPEERQDVAFGNLVFAGELFSDAHYGYMNGGAQTGRLAAEMIIGML